MIGDSFELLTALKRAGYLHTSRDPLWWPRSGTQEVLIGAILTQQTKWERVEESLEMLRENDLSSLEALAQTPSQKIAEYIKPSGFYNTKAQRLKQLAENILADFGDFKTFQESVDREWLLEQKGIGMESADSILCYGAARPVFLPGGTCRAFCCRKTFRALPAGREFRRTSGYRRLSRKFRFSLSVSWCCAR